MAPRTDKLLGSIDLLVLKALERGPTHGYGIVCHIQRVSRVLEVEEGSLYPALHRMEQARWIAADWGTSENGRRAKYYSLTPAGQKQLAAETERWEKTSRAIGRVLRYVE